jgi:hypothetical protein
MLSTIDAHLSDVVADGLRLGVMFTKRDWKARNWSRGWLSDDFEIATVLDEHCAMVLEP